METPTLAQSVITSAHQALHEKVWAHISAQYVLPISTSWVPWQYLSSNTDKLKVEEGLV